MELPIFGYCDSCQDNGKFIDGKCTYCGAEKPDEVKPYEAFKVSDLADMRHLEKMWHTTNDNDPDHIPDGQRMRDPRYPKHMTGEQLEKMYEEGVKAKRRMRQELGAGDHGEMRMSIPPELFHGKRKVDPHYWQDPKNVAKHRARWGV